MLKALAKSTKKAVLSSTSSSPESSSSSASSSSSLSRSQSAVDLTRPRSAPTPTTPTPITAKSVYQREHEPLAIVKYSAPFEIAESGTLVQVVFASASCINVVNKAFVDILGLTDRMHAHEEQIEIEKFGNTYENTCYGYIELTLIRDHISEKVPFLVFRQAMYPIIWGKSGNCHLEHLDVKNRSLYGTSFAAQEKEVKVPAVKLMSSDFRTASVYRLTRLRPSYMSLLPWSVKDVVVSAPLPERTIYIKTIEHHIHFLDDRQLHEKLDNLRLTSSPSRTTSSGDSYFTYTPTSGASTPRTSSTGQVTPSWATTPTGMQTPQTPSSHPYPLRRSDHSYSDLVKAELAHSESNRTALNDMLVNKLIRPSSSVYTSPIKFNKEDSTFNVDFTELNKKIFCSHFSFPKVKPLLNKLNGASLFAKIRLLDAYHQIPLRETDRHLTAFSTPYGTFEFNVLPHGLAGADATVHTTLETIMRRFLGEFVLVYLDTILIFSSSKNEHAQHTMRVLETLYANGFYVDREHYKVFQPKVDFLDHLVSQDTISPLPACIDSLRASALKFADASPSFPPAKDQFQQFFDRLRFYRRFVPDFALESSPIHDFCLGLVPWSDDCSRCMMHLLDLLTEGPPSLALPNISPRNPGFIMTPSVHATTLSCELRQVGVFGSRVVEYFSKRLCQNDAIGLSPSEKEMFAIVQGLDRWRSYIKSSIFTVRASESTLSCLATQRSNVSARMANWCSIVANSKVVLSPV